MSFAIIRGLIAHAFPILIAQLASIGMMVIDTVILGHISPEDLAAVAIGGGIDVSVVFALVGVLQAVGPLVARHHGAGDRDAAVSILQQGVWLALLLCVPGIVFLMHPGVLLGTVEISPEIEYKVRLYLSILAWGLPAALIYRTFYTFCNALGRPKVLMLIGLGALVSHGFLAWGFAAQGWLGWASGVAGCALSNVVIAFAACLIAAIYLVWGPVGLEWTPWRKWQWPRWSIWRELLRLGVPMGLSNFVEITAFTLISLFIASLGADVVAGHRIAANLSALAYMLPLSLGIATMTAVGHAVGARDWRRARGIFHAGLVLAVVSSSVLGLVMWLATRQLVAAYTDDPQVQAVAASLIIYIAIYQFFDALQTIAGHALRAYRVTFVPMLIQTFCFWGIGLLGGAWLCYRGTAPFGVAGFWIAAALGLVVAAALLLPLLFRVAKANEATP